MFVEKIDKTIGLAVSGGMDSMAMLHCYRLVCQKIVVINIEHGIRGESSQKDSAFVKNYCEKNGIPVLFFSVKTLEECKKTKESVESAARRLRYEIFDNLLADKTVDVIALAHHADDNAETVLMRIFRGTGIKGLGGIIQRSGYIRPLLKYTRTEIEEYVKQNNIPFVEDETNQESDYTRNFIRLEILPKIKERYKEVTKSITRLSENALEIDEYLSAQIGEIVTNAQECIIKDLFSKDVVIQKYTIREAFARLGITQDIEARHIDSILELKNKENNTSIDMPYFSRAIRHNSDLIITVASGEEFWEEFDITKNYTYKGNSYMFSAGEKIVSGISFDCDKVPDGAVIRSRLCGDVFKRVNGKTKLLSDFLGEQKLPSTEKEKILVLADRQTILAVLGYETSDLIKIDNTTKKIIHIIKECL